MENTKEKTKHDVAEIKLTYRSRVKPSERARISGSKEAYELLLTNWDSSKIEFLEQFKILLLNRANRVLGIFEVSSGGVSGTVVDPRLVFAAAIKANASGIILSHNHPSGNLTPSQSDIDLTRKMKEGGKMLEIQVLDHVILTKESYYSFADEGLI